MRFSSILKVGILSALALTTVVAQAALGPLWNTGDGLANPNGATDIHWTTSTTQSIGSSALTYTHPNYTAPGFATPASNWIGQASAPAVGSTWFALQFDLTGYNLSTVSFAGKWASDNDAFMYLNSNPTSLASHVDVSPSGPYTFQFADTFTLSSGFIAGMNTLWVEVLNGSQYTQNDNPTALRVEFSEFRGQPVPEPFTMILGAAGIGLALKRRLKKSI